ncbi:MAG TPA: hypothetical protein PK752_04410 [Accumulibacter sp.]|uniref:hypothetical protein n=1 Tax=Accumulibacter sp. TaxID=2053492 RepID=UPI002BA26638|nr:hypothetical protein [Accumulibacter sp.]HRD87491.1 hypothetical protein [Accumulibacter sp.]
MGEVLRNGGHDNGQGAADAIHESRLIEVEKRMVGAHRPARQQSTRRVAIIAVTKSQHVVTKSQQSRFCIVWIVARHIKP